MCTTVFHFHSVWDPYNFDADPPIRRHDSELFQDPRIRILATTFP